MFDEKTNSIYIHRDVLFNESQFSMEDTSQGLQDPGVVQTPEQVGAPLVLNEVPAEVEQQQPEGASATVASTGSTAPKRSCCSGSTASAKTEKVWQKKEEAREVWTVCSKHCGGEQHRQ